MSTSERLHRIDPEQSGPLRHAGTYLRDPAPESAWAQQPAGAGAVDDAVAHGVRLGYQVIEEQILEGQRLAQRLGGKGPDAIAPGGAGEVTALIERALGLYKDLGKLCIDAVARSAATGSGFANGAQPPQPAPDPTRHDAAPAQGGETRLSIEVASQRRVQVCVDLRLSPRLFVPRVHALHAADPSIPALVAVSFQLDPALADPVLRVEVPDAQPAATYTGVVVDSASNAPRGFVSVRVLP